MEKYQLHVVLVLALVAFASCQVHHRMPNYSRKVIHLRMVRYVQCGGDVVHGTCQCQCDDGSVGEPPACQNPCQPNPCLNGGSCSITKDDEEADYTCTCPPGYVGKDCEYEEECRVKGAPTTAKLNYDSGTWLNIFVDFEIDCFGRVVQWEFHAKKRGTVILTIWRPVGEQLQADSWQLIGKNSIRVRRRGQHVVFIAEEDQIAVQVGDVFGIQYPEFMVTPEDDRGIISYTDDNVWGPGLCCGITDDMLSRIHNVAIQDEDLPIGVQREGLRDFRRAVALHAFIHNPRPQCSVQGGPMQLLNYDSGVWLNIFVDRAFDCAGPITRWRFHAKKTGTVFLTAWRPDSDNESWTLIGKNRIVVTRLDIQDAFIQESDQIEVQDGDVIGMQYPEDAFDPDDDRGIISYTDTRIDGDGLCCGVTEEDLSQIHNVAVPDEQLDIGVVHTGLRPFSRAVALHAFVNDFEEPKTVKSKKVENLTQLLKNQGWKKAHK